MKFGLGQLGLELELGRVRIRRLGLESKSDLVGENCSLDWRIPPPLLSLSCLCVCVCGKHCVSRQIFDFKSEVHLFLYRIHIGPLCSGS